MADESEIEIKLRLDPKEIDRFAALEALAGRARERKHLRTTYFDDRRRRLTRKGLELRVRSDGGGRVQTIKSGAGLRRGEWQRPIPGETPDLGAARGTPAQKLLSKAADLEPMFVVEIERRSWRVEKDGGVAEVTLDNGEIASKERREPIAEAEFELKSGSPRLLFELARQTIGPCDAPPSFVGKALRGRRLQQGVSETPQRELDLDLRTATTAAAAFRTVVDACLRQISLNEEIARRRPGDIEATHQLRVAFRRLRAALSLFKPMIAGEPLEALKRELRWISDLLGEARDLDVFATRAIPRARTAHPGVASLDKLREACEGLRREARRALDDALGSERFRLLLLDVVEFAHAGRWASDPARSKLRETRVPAFAAEHLQRRLGAMTRKKDRERVAGASETDRHRLRIKAKKLRYMAQFFGSLASGKGFGRALEALHGMQKSLGAVHDSVAAEQIVARLLGERSDAELAFAAGILREEAALKAACIEAASIAHAELRRGAPFHRAF